MRRIGFACALSALAWPAAAAQGVTDGALARAARAAILRDIDPNEQQCRPDRSVAVWLKELAGQQAKSIVWSGGACRLKNPDNPRDSGGRWCGQAEITLKKPKNRSDSATIEIYFETPEKGKPGKPYAFRARMVTTAGEDVMRFPADFEANWRERFSPDAPRDPACE